MTYVNDFLVYEFGDLCVECWARHDGRALFVLSGRGWHSRRLSSHGTSFWLSLICFNIDYNLDEIRKSTWFRNIFKFDRFTRHFCPRDHLLLLKLMKFINWKFYLIFAAVNKCSRDVVWFPRIVILKIFITFQFFWTVQQIRDAPAKWNMRTEHEESTCRATRDARCMFCISSTSPIITHPIDI